MGRGLKPGSPAPTIIEAIANPALGKSSVGFSADKRRIDLRRDREIAVPVAIGEPHAQGRTCRLIVDLRDRFGLDLDHSKPERFSAEGAPVKLSAPGRLRPRASGCARAGRNR